MKITKNTTDLKIGSVLKAIHIEDDAPFELNKFYKITNGDCVGTFEIGNVIAFAYTINELGDYFEHITSLEDIENLEKKALILKETFEQIKNMSNDKNVYVFTDNSIEQETIAFLVQDEVFNGDEIELRFICDNMDIRMVEQCSCCGEILLPDDECYEDDLNNSLPLCDHCSVYDEDREMYIRTIHQDVLENITGFKFSHLIGNVSSIVDSFNNWINENNYVFGIFEDTSKARFVEFLTEQTELNICDICGLIEKTTDLNWSDEDLFDEDYQNFRFLQGTKISFESICDDCLNKVGTISQPSLEDITTRIQENQMMHKVFDVVLLENVNFKERNIKQTTVVGEICYMDFDKKTYKLKEFGEHEFKDEDFFDILNSAYVNEYVEFIAEKYPEKINEVDEWSYPNYEGFPDIDYAFKEFGYKDEFIEYLKAIDLPYGRFLTPKFNIGDEFTVHFDYYEADEFTTHTISSIDTTFDEADEIVYWSDNFVYIAESELEKQKQQQKSTDEDNVDNPIDEVQIIKDDLLHNLFCLEEENGIVVPTFDELISAKKILPCWELCEKYEDFSYDSVINEINEQCENFFIALEALEAAKNKDKKNKKYGVRQIVEHGLPIEIIEVLHSLHTYDNYLPIEEERFICLQAKVKTMDFSSIEIVLQCDMDYKKIEEYLLKELDKEFHEEVLLLIEVIKEAKADNHTTLHLYDC